MTGSTHTFVADIGHPSLRFRTLILHYIKILLNYVYFWDRIAFCFNLDVHVCHTHLYPIHKLRLLGNRDCVTHGIKGRGWYETQAECGGGATEEVT